MDAITRFVILFEGRTGSSFVVSCLADHPNIVAVGEPLGDKGDKTAAEQQAWLETFFGDPRKAHTISIGRKARLRELFGSKGKTDIGAIGFKTKLRVIEDRDAFGALLDRYDCKVVHLDRKNVIKQALSGLNLERLYRERGQFNLQQGEEPLPAFAPTIAQFEDAIQFKLDKNRLLEAYLDSLARPRITLYYEEILADQEAFFAKLLAFLGVQNRPMKGRVAKATKDDMRQALLNYDEIREHFSARGYAEMFD